jgi:hypothetical protein
MHSQDIQGIYSTSASIESQEINKETNIFNMTKVITIKQQQQQRDQNQTT